MRNIQAFNSTAPALGPELDRDAMRESPEPVAQFTKADELDNVIQNEVVEIESDEESAYRYRQEHCEGPITYWPDRSTAKRFGSVHHWKIGRVRWYHEDIVLHWMPSTREFFIVDDYDSGDAYVRYADDGDVINWFMIKHAQVIEDNAFLEDWTRR